MDKQTVKESPIITTDEQPFYDNDEEDDTDDFDADVNIGDGEDDSSDDDGLLRGVEQFIKMSERMEKAVGKLLKKADESTRKLVDLEYKQRLLIDQLNMMTL